MDQQNQLQEANLSEPDALSNCTTNDVLADLNHKLKIETESEMPKNRHGLKQSIKILGNGDNALYRLGDKTYLLERIEFWKTFHKSKWSSTADEFFENSVFCKRRSYV